MDSTGSIAIVGMAVRVPGASNIEEFWTNLVQGKESISFLSDDELRSSGVPDSFLNQANYVRAAGILEQEDLFDASFFDFSPHEARLLDPQHRVFLEISWEVLERAGYSPATFPGSIGVFAGCCLNEYLNLQQTNVFSPSEAPSVMPKFMALLAIDKDYLSTRVSYKLNLRGPSMTIQTACSTSLVAIDLACQSLILGECDLALAGGISIRPPQKSGYPYTPDMIFSQDGHTYAFDTRATGTLFTNGAGIVALKRLEDAIADQDHIEAVIRGWAINNDGSQGKSAFSAPSQNGQAEVIAEALAMAEVDPSSISYVEAHGTATALGDPIEVSALTQIFREFTSEKQFCAIGSVKSNIGHPVHAAGVVGLIKAALMLKHKKLVPSVNYDRPNPQIDFENSPFYVNTRLKDWETNHLPRRAGVSSFGVGGTNCHVIVEEAQEQTKQNNKPGVQLLKLSAKSEAALKTLASVYADYLENSKPPLEEVCYTANTGRSDFNHRLGIVAATRKDFQDRLRIYTTSEKTMPGTEARPTESNPVIRVGFLFSGQGCQYPNMGRKLYETEPDFRDSIDRCDEILRDLLPQRLLSVLHPSNPKSTDLDQTLYTQPALFALEYSLAQLWISRGIEPDVVLGHSIGEYVAACISGIFSLEQALELVAERSRMMNELTETGDMVAVFAAPDSISEYLSEYRATVSIAAVNAPDLTILSGLRSALSKLLATLETQKIIFKRLKVSHAFHSPLMNPILDRFEQVASKFEFLPPQKNLISNLTGTPLDDELPYNAKYLRRHIRETVQFSQCIQTLKEQNCNFIIEIGPHPVLMDIARKQLVESQINFFPSLNRDVDDVTQILESTARLYSSGANIQWNTLYKNRKTNRVELPTYPFERKRYWIEQQTFNGTSAGAPMEANLHPLLGRRLHSPLSETQFETVLNINELRFLQDHKVYNRIIFPAAGYLEMMVAAAREITGLEAASFHEVIFREPLFLDEDSHVLHLIWKPIESGKATIEIFHRTESSWKLHVSAEYRSMNGGQGRPPHELEKIQRDSLAMVQKRCMAPVGIPEFYAQKREIGMNHGPSFQGVQRVWKGTAEALAQIELPESLRSTNHNYLAHPSMIDSCFQVKEAAIERSPTNRKLYLPIVLERFTVHGRLPSSLWVWVRRYSQQSNDDLRTINISAMDETDRVLMEIERLHLKAANPIYSAASAEETNNLYEVEWQLAPLSTDHPQKPERSSTMWMIFCDSRDSVCDLGEKLQTQGKVIYVSPSSSKSVKGDHWQINPTFEDFQWLFQETENGYRQEVLYLWGADSIPNEWDMTRVDSALETLLELTRWMSWKESPLSLWLVTRGAQRVTKDSHRIPLHQFPLWGFGKVISREPLNFSCKLVDLDPGDFDWKQLADEILFNSSSDQIAFRNQKRYLPQMIRIAPARIGLQQTVSIPSEFYQVVVHRPGQLDSITAIPKESTEPGSHEVLIQVHATGLNFRDVLIAIGRFEGPLGFECSGVVIKKGPLVQKFHAGDEVFCMTSSAMSSNVCVDEKFVMAKPHTLTLDQAAGIPLPFVTAYHALNRCARLQKGERVLIHAAAGGVGLAAIQLAGRQGAEIFATASPAKWDYLKSLGIPHVLNSRNLEFTDYIRNATAGKGVDVVLNSLADEFIPATVSVLSDHGRFVEIGATNTLLPNQFAGLKPRASYFAFHLREIAEQDPSGFQDMLREIVLDIEQGNLKVLPTQIFPVTETVNAFRHMAQAKHIGKIVISHQQRSNEHGTVKMHPDASYLITGGLGALGLYTAQWLAEKGAKHIVLLGRRVPSDQAQATIRSIEEQGAQVHVLQGDVTCFERMDQVLTEIETSLPPLRGIWHTAGVLSDALLRQQSIEKMKTVTDPKIHGSWNLHRLTSSKQLDYFVLFSSMSAIWGAPGQTTYAAANSFLDGLAHFRRSIGLPAISINWGSWGGGGMAVALPETIRAQRHLHGLLEILPDAAFKAMEKVLQSDLIQVGITDIDWSKFMQEPTAKNAFFFSTFAKEMARPESKEKPAGNLLKELLSPPENNHLPELIRQLSESVAKTLGIQALDLHSNQSLAALGFDSLMSIELSNRIQNSFGIHVPMVLFLKGLTIEQLAVELLEKLKSDLITSN